MVFSIFSWYGLNRIAEMHVEKKSELRSLLKSGDKRCKLVEPRNAKSCVWRFFNLVSCDDRIEPYACCKTCGDLLSYSGKTGTGSLLRHRCLHTTNGKFGSDIHARPLTLPRVFRAGTLLLSSPPFVLVLLYILDVFFSNNCVWTWRLIHIFPYNKTIHSICKLCVINTEPCEQ